MTNSTIAARAATLVKQGHAKRVFSTDAEGNPVNSGSERARCFCLFGALNRACYEHTGKVITPPDMFVAMVAEAKERSLMASDDDVLDAFIRLTKWNDQPTTDGAQVAGFLDAVAKRLDANQEADL